MANGSALFPTYENGVHAGRSAATGIEYPRPPMISHPEAPMLFPQGQIRQIHPHMLQQRGVHNSIHRPTPNPAYIAGMPSYSLFPGSNSTQPGHAQLQHTTQNLTLPYTNSFNHAPVVGNVQPPSRQEAYSFSGSFDEDLPAPSSYPHHSHPGVESSRPGNGANAQLPSYPSQTPAPGGMDGSNPTNVYGHPPTHSLPIAQNVLRSRYGRGTFQTPETSPVRGLNSGQPSPYRLSVDHYDRSINGNSPSRTRAIQSQQSITPPRGDDQRRTRHPMGMPGSDQTSPSSTDGVSSESPEVLMCNVRGCGARFTGEYRKGNLGRHNRNQHGGAEGKKKEYRCEEPNCSNSYKRKDARLKHYRKEHPERPDAVEPQPRRPTGTPQSQ